MRWRLERALLPTGLADDVCVEVEGGRFTHVGPGEGDRVRGLALPGLANAHSHAFHRALRGRVGGADFWGWRTAMYALAERLDPDRYLALARSAYAEMALAGVTTVGEFHYLHHRAGGRPYDDPNAMGHALQAAAADAGVRLTLLDACYLRGGFDQELDAVQQRFSDGSAAAWRDRVGLLRAADDCVVGAAIHSVRAVPADRLGEVDGLPLHVHLSEQPAENADCQAVHGVTPTRLLADHGVLGPRTTAVHATHLTGSDVGLLAESGATVCACPTTEADLGDGVGPFAALVEAGVPLSLGSDQQGSVDLLAEHRALERWTRLATGRRWSTGPAPLVAHASLGWPDAGMIEVGARADLVVLDTDSVRTAGTSEPWRYASAADVRTVVSNGRVVVADGEHVLGPVGPLLAAAIDLAWS